MPEINGSSQRDSLNGALENDTIIGWAGEDGLLGLELNDWISGNTDNDFLSGNTGSDTVRGGKENDIVHGGQDNDLLYGDLGSDTVCGDIGDDTVIGGNGNNHKTNHSLSSPDQQTIDEDESDVLFGNAGNDYINGNAENDTVYGGEGNDLLHGGKNDDQLFGNLGEDQLRADLGNDTGLGGEGNDQLVGGEGEDYLNGNTEDDWVAGNEGNDTVHGGQGNDTVHGGKDNDLLFGDLGNDVLIGDLGSDILNGGEGDDTFVIGRRDDVAGYRTTGGINIADADWVLDFGTGSDKFELIGGITFDDLNIFAGTGEYAGYTIIQDKVLGEYLAILKGFTGTLSRENFISLTPTPPTSPGEDPETPPPAPGGGDPPPDPTPSSPNDILLSSVAVNENSPAGTLIGSLSASDPDADDTHTYALLDDAGGRFIINGNQLKVAPGASLDFETQPSHTIKVRVTDAAGNIFDKDFPITLQNINEAPATGNPIVDQLADADTPFNFTFAANTFTDPDGDALTYTATLPGGEPLPAWLTFNPTTRTFSGTPTNGDVGTLTINVQASDGKGGSVSDTFNLEIGHIEDEPTVGNPIADLNTPEDSVFNFTFADTTFTDADGDALTYTAKLTNGEPLPAWLTFNPITRTFSGTPTDADVGTLSIDVQASDGNGGSAIDTFNLVIDNVNDEPTIDNSIADQNTLEDVTFNFTFASTTFNDPDGDPLTYTAKLTNGATLPAWLTFNPTTRTFSGTPTNEDVGTLSIDVEALDGKGGRASDTFNLVISNVNNPPTVVNPIAELNTREDSVFNFTFVETTFNDPDGDPLTYTATLTGGEPLPAWLIFNPGTRTFSGTPTDGDVGTLSIKVEASDGNGGIVINTFNLVINPIVPPGTEPIVVNPITDQNTLEDATFNFQFAGTTFEDPDGDPLTYTAKLTNGAILPTWLTFNPSTRTFSGTPTNEDVGTLSIDAEASDGKGGRVIDTFNLVIGNVNDVPTVVNPIAGLNTLEDATFNFTFDVDTFNDIDGDALTYSATLTGGAALPTWLTFNPTTRTFSGTPANGDVGTLSIDVQASDGNGGSVINTLNLVIDNVNDAPTVATAIAEQNTDAGTAYNFTFDVNIFNDIDGDPLTYTAKLTNGSILPAWLTFNAANHTFSGTPSNGDAATLSIDVQASDGNGGSVTETFNLVVKGNSNPIVATPIGDQNTPEDSVFNYTFAANTFTDPDGDTLTYSATQTGGAALPAWLTFNAATRTFSGTPANGDVRTLSIDVQASDGNGGIAIDTFSLVVNNVNDPPIVATPLIDLNTDEDSVFNYTFAVNTFTDPDNDTLTYSATQTGGDALPAWLTFNAATRTFSGTPTNGDAATLSINVEASDGNGGSVTDTFNLTVGNGPESSIVVVTAIDDQSATQDATFNFTFAETTFNDLDGDALTYTATQTGGDALPAWLTFNAATRTFSGPPANGDVGNLSIDVQASDGTGDSAIDTFNLVVNNVNDDPIVATPIGDQNTLEDSVFNFTFAANTFTDPDGDALTYSATLADGEPLPAWLTFNAATRTFSGTPANGDVRTLSIDVQASDGNGGSVTETFNLGVINTNDAPTVVTAIADQNANAGTAFNYTFAATTFNDIDGDVLTYSATLDNNAPLPAWLTFNPTTRTFSGTPPNGAATPLSINVQASDGNGGSVIDTFTLTVGTSNVPVAVNDIITTPVLLSSRLEIPVATLLANDTDADLPADTLTITAVTAANGTASINNGIITYRATPGFAGTTTLNYTVSDSTGLTDTGTVTLTVASQVQLSAIATGTNVPVGSGGFSVNGQAAFEWAGFSVNGAGDVNGDGFADVIIGAPSASAPAPGSGKSYVVFGGPSGSNGGFVINGQAGYDRAGISVNGAGDVNGDGLADLIIGADRADDPTIATRLSSGKSYVVFGKADNAPVNLTAVAANPGTGGFVINGEWIGIESGFSVSGAGDVNGDGLDDLIVGAPAFGLDANNNGVLVEQEYLRSGRAYVVFGKANNTVPINLNAISNGTGGFAITFEGVNDQAGNSVSSAGDVNGDGLADLIVGAYLADPNGNFSAGKAYVVYGKTTTTAVALGAVAVAGNTGGFAINGQAANDRLGRSVSEAGDVNGDGFADVIVGAYNAGPNQTSSGTSYVVFGGPSGNNGGFTINGETAGDHAGISVSSAGDVNGDGLDDLIVGARWADPNGAFSGKSYVVFGKADNTAVNLSAVAAGIGGFALNGASANNLAGRSVSGAGDLNGDGFADLIVGAFGAAPIGANSGTSYVVYGGDFTASVTGMGTATADVLTGTTAADILVGGLGNDQLIGNGGADVLYGGAGEDIVTISDTGFRRIDGGLGTDTLLLVGAGMALDLTAIRNPLIQGIERINMTGAGNNTLSLGVRDVISLSGSTSTLTVEGNVGDIVTASGFAFASTTANGFNQYTSSSATLLVQTGVTVNVLL
ncbi:putative Ig domain-containing protein [Microcoleus sp. FACHB-672]|uniref:putative Ig domain-containing protein n=1 Tax=Microcoleus sp. FACHB-672 TaxID=2692825 RepID=UPI0016834A06|nr:putative Ig domain-containing protein [Microcoleus sp. FACHB-672]MBD2043131.1 putative Ig domain-containing protein [Microcoleus sp. FACHB-672]